MHAITIIKHLSAFMCHLWSTLYYCQYGNSLFLHPVCASCIPNILIKRSSIEILSGEHKLLQPEISIKSQSYKLLNWTSLGELKYC